MAKKPQSAKSKAAKAKREKIFDAPLDDAVRQRLEDSYERTWGGGGVMEASYPSNSKMTEADIMTAAEVNAIEEKVYGKRGELNDDVPDFLHNAAKAGPPVLDHLGRTASERKGLKEIVKDVKERKIMDAIALGEKEHPVIYAGAPKPDISKRVVTIMKDHDLQYPDLYMAVYVAGDWHVRDDEARFARLFARSGCYKADTIEEADLVVFGGGVDVEPLLYGEDNSQRHPTVYYDPKRDAADMEIYLKARSQGTPMMGVCRGAQFLHVMNGGKLYQDIDGHNGPHKAFALREREMIEKVTSVHHQACIFNKEMEVLLSTSSASTVRWLDKDRKETSAKIDIEAFYYRDTGCFGVQGHPEYSGANRFSVWCLEKLSELFLTSQDFTWTGKRLQMTPEARDAQKIAEQYIEKAYEQSKEA